MYCLVDDDEKRVKLKNLKESDVRTCHLHLHCMTLCMHELWSTLIITLQDAFKFLEAQLHLFAQLCKVLIIIFFIPWTIKHQFFPCTVIIVFLKNKYIIIISIQGSNSRAIDELNRDCLDHSSHGYVSLTEIFICLQISKKRKEESKEEKEEEEGIHPVLKSRYIELILVMFVAVRKNRSFVGHICYSFVSNYHLSMILTSSVFVYNLYRITWTWRRFWKTWKKIPVHLMIRKTTNFG